MSLEQHSTVDETFIGAVAGLSIPPAFIDLVRQIQGFQGKASQNPNAGTVTSESFGGYSYTVATGESGLPATWKEAFRERLHLYRRQYPEVIL